MTEGMMAVIAEMRVSPEDFMSIRGKVVEAIKTIKRDANIKIQYVEPAMPPPQVRA